MEYKYPIIIVVDSQGLGLALAWCASDLIFRETAIRVVESCNQPAHMSERFAPR
jgi:hypothetical protein